MSRDNKSRPTLTRRDFLAGSTASVAAAGVRAGDRAGSQSEKQAQSTGAPGEAFPKDFVWGAASSAHQIEGATQADGRGASIWDEFSKRAGVTFQGETAEVACDHYRRYREDVALMKQIGLRAYRFSVSWSRVLPQGTGQVNQKGLDFYRRLVDELLAAGIEPWLTLYHWDYPQALQARGGWLNRESAAWMAEYAKVVAGALSDRVRNWLTINEPRSFIGGGYRLGVHAPGEKLPLADVVQAGHALFLAHGKAVQAIRAGARGPIQVGFAPDFSPSLPFPDTAENQTAARAASFAFPAQYFEAARWWRGNTWWIDPAIRGEYPADGLAALGSDAPRIEAGDMATICQPLDFFALNIYGGHPVRAGEGGGSVDALWPVGWPRTAFGWDVTPEALYWGPKWLYERHQMPIYITENGLSCHDWVSRDGRVHDPQRIDFISRYLLALRRATQEGVPVRGYFYWTLLDNFEWAEGYRQRFGLVHVDFASLKRTQKDSAHWYHDLIASSGGSLR